MAVLIVDDESSTRLSLRGLLEQMGYKAVLEAKNGEEGLRVLESEKARVRLIIADWEMPYMDGLKMLAEVAKKREYDSAPFLLITSDLPAAEIKKLQSSQSRLDGYLIKPFRRKMLEEAILVAQKHCASLRTEFALFGGRQCETALASALTEAFGPSTKLTAIETEPSLTKLVADAGWKLGAIFIDPPVQIGEWMTQFKKSPTGAATPIVSLSAEPEEVSAYRTQAQYFFDARKNSENSGFWKKIAEAVRGRVSGFWAIEHLYGQLKVELQEKNGAGAAKTAKEMLKLDSSNPEVLRAVAESAELCGDIAGALASMRAALAVNPCQPRFYIKCFEFLGESRDPELAETAARFCPGNADVLFACARQWKLLGDTKKSGEALEKCLALNPKHKAALEMRGGGDA